MRTRTEERRLAIIEAAKEIFLNQGFDAASMSEISERVGGSKATLYGYFPSKEELFIACLRDFSREETGAVKESFAGKKSLRERLETFGRWRLKLALTPGGLSVHRMIWSVGVHSIIAKMFGDVDPADTTWGLVATELKKAMDSGELRQADPWSAAQHFRGLLDTEAMDRYYFQYPSAVDDRMTENFVLQATDVFLRAYAPEGAPAMPRKRRVAHTS